MRQTGLGEHRVVGGGEDLGEAAGLGQERLSGTGIRVPLVDHRQLGLAAAADDGHHAVADVEALGPGPRSTTSPASSSPGMSCGEPGGAG